MDPTSKEIIENYDHLDEDGRLKSAYGILEEEHTKRLIARHLDGQHLDIYDIGGGTGHYSLWLASLGHRVHFSDIVPKHVEMCRDRLGAQKNIVSIGIEDARKLSYQNDMADVVVLNGPLYHLTRRSDRIQVLKEVKRILKPHGRLLGFSITRLAGLTYALSSGEIFNDAYFEMVKREVESGVRDNADFRNKTFNRAFFHTQDEIEAEFNERGLRVEKSFGVVGQAWIAPNLDQVISDPEKKARLLLGAEMMERYPMQSPKILTVGIKNN